MGVRGIPVVAFDFIGIEIGIGIAVGTCLAVASRSRLRDLQMWRRRTLVTPESRRRRIEFRISPSLVDFDCNPDFDLDSSPENFPAYVHEMQPRARMMHGPTKPRAGGKYSNTPGWCQQNAHLPGSPSALDICPSFHYCPIETICSVTPPPPVPGKNPGGGSRRIPTSHERQTMKRATIVLFWVLCGPGLVSTPARCEQHGTDRLEPSHATSTGRSVGTWLVSLFRDHISAVDGDRCPSIPTCSSYSVRAFEKHGFVMGWLMTVDRLIHEADEGSHAPLVRSGGRLKIHDPVEANDFWWNEETQRR